MAGDHFWKEALLFIFDEQGSDLDEITNQFKRSRTSVYQLMHNMKKKGWINRVGKKYVISNLGKEELTIHFPQLMQRMLPKSETITRPLPPPIEEEIPAEIAPIVPTLPVPPITKDSETFFRDKFVELTFELVKRLGQTHE